MNVLIIDNYDSFTYNLYQFVGEILSSQKLIEPGFDFGLTVKRNNEITLEEINAQEYDRIIISPGPGSPDDHAYFGVCADVIEQLGPKIPLLGVCLGMQGIVHILGGKVVKATVPMHGKLSPIVHDGQGVFSQIPQELEIMRYHSLMAEQTSLPDCLNITAYCASGVGEAFCNNNEPKGEIMGVRHKRYPIEGIQFHPESFASEGGKEMIKNFLFRV